MLFKEFFVVSNSAIHKKIIEYKYILLSIDKKYVIIIRKRHILFDGWSLSEGDDSKLELCFLCADTCKESSDAWRKDIYELAAKKDFTYKLYALTLGNVWQSILYEEMKMISFAFINIGLPDSLEIGEALYKANPFCRIVYYEKGEKPLKKWLRSRPVNYINTLEPDFDTGKVLESEYNEFVHQTGIYHYKDKFHSLSIPYSGIMYFYIYNRMTYCMTSCGEQGPIRKSIDIVESEVGSDCFIRCHKSFLVSKKSCIGFDKTNKELILSNQERINVSRAYLKEIIREFC